MSIAMNANQEHANYSAGDPDPPRPGRLKQEGLEDSERNYSVFMHLAPLAGLIFGPLFILPLVLWLVRKDQSSFNDDHGREVLNFMISFVVLSLILGVSIIGIPFILVLGIVGFVNLIRGAVAAGNGEYFRYPLTWRFIN